MPGILDFLGPAGPLAGMFGGAAMTANQPMQAQSGGMFGAGRQVNPDAAGGQGMFGRAFTGLSNFNERHPGFLWGVGNVIADRDPTPAMEFGFASKLAKKEQAEKLRKQNMTRDWLIRNKGMSPEDADAVIAAGAAGDYFKPPKGMNGEDASYFGTPMFVEQPDGSIVPYQLSDRGTAKQIDLGTGNKLAPPTRVINTETEQIVMDNWGNVISRTPIENMKAAEQTAVGKGRGEALVAAEQALPGVAGIAGLIDAQVQALKNDPYLPNMVGPVWSRMPNVSGDAARVQSMIDQLQGGAFLQARQMLKGGGAITDYEGQKAEAAFVRMNQAQNVEDFKRALDEFNAAVQQGLRKLQGQAGVPAAPPATGGRLRYNPETGELE